MRPLALVALVAALGTGAEPPDRVQQRWADRTTAQIAHEVEAQGLPEEWFAPLPEAPEWTRGLADAANLGAGEPTQEVRDFSGGDGANSLRMPDGRTLWFFNDVFAGSLDAQLRRSWPESGPLPGMAHNAIVVQPASGPLTTMMRWSSDHRQRPLAWIGETGSTGPSPEPSPDPVAGSWLWTLGQYHDPARDRIVQVAVRKRTDASGELVTAGLVLAALDPRTLEVRWTREIRPWGFGDGNEAAQVDWGTALLVQGDTVYFYGTRTVPGAYGLIESRIRVARAYLDSVDRVETWQYARFGPEGQTIWDPAASAAPEDLREGPGRPYVTLGADFSARVIDGRVTLFGATYGRPTRYTATGPGQGGPTGPFAATLYRVPPFQNPADPAYDSCLMPAYAYKVHPQTTGPQGTLVGYSVNVAAERAADPGCDVHARVETYRPRFQWLPAYSAGAALQRADAP